MNPAKLEYWILLSANSIPIQMPSQPPLFVLAIDKLPISPSMNSDYILAPLFQRTLPKRTRMCTRVLQCPKVVLFWNGLISRFKLQWIDLLPSFKWVQWIKRRNWDPRRVFLARPHLKLEWNGSRMGFQSPPWTIPGSKWTTTTPFTLKVRQSSQTWDLGLVVVNLGKIYNIFRWNDSISTSWTSRGFPNTSPSRLFLNCYTESRDLRG